MAMTGSDAKRGITGINVTPLIDVLLIIFMVIVPVRSHGLQSSIPQPAKPGEPPAEATVELQVVAGPTGQVMYLLNQTPLEKFEIERKLSGLFASRQHKVLFVKADPSIEYARVAEVIDMGHRAQVDDIGLITPHIQNGQ